jgi:hypothetical protein
MRYGKPSIWTLLRVWWHAPLFWGMPIVGVRPAPVNFRNAFATTTHPETIRGALHGLRLRAGCQIVAWRVVALYDFIHVTVWTA